MSLVSKLVISYWSKMDSNTFLLVQKRVFSNVSKMAINNLPIGLKTWKEKKEKKDGFDPLAPNEVPLEIMDQGDDEQVRRNTTFLSV